MSHKKDTKVNAVKSGWSIVYILRESQIVFLPLKIDLGLANSEDPDKMPRGISSGSTMFAKVRYTNG